MSKLAALRITECPAALADFARKHNALVDMLAEMTGESGVKTTVSENNIVIGSDIAALVAAVIAALATAEVTIQTLHVTGDAFVNYLESSGAVYADGSIWINGLEVTTLNAVETCSPAGTNDFLVLA